MMTFSGHLMVNLLLQRTIILMFDILIQFFVDSVMHNSLNITTNLKW